MDTEKIDIKTGCIVEGKDFFGRKKELREAWDDRLLKGVSVLLSSPRRVGKSSFARRVLQVAKENGWATLHLDLQGTSTENQFVEHFLGQLQKEGWMEKSTLKNLVAKVAGSIESDKLKLNTDRWYTLDSIKRVIDGSDHGLIVVDELGCYLECLLREEDGEAKVETFLTWLRRCRLEPGTKVRWIFCSSIGIENFLSMNKLSKHFNDVASVRIAEFSEEEAKEFISRLNVHAKEAFTSEHIRYILDKLGWHLPFFIQLLVYEIDNLMKHGGHQLSRKTIDEAYDRLLDATQHHFYPWEERLKDYGTPGEENAHVILKACACPKGESKDNLLAIFSKRMPDIDKAEEELAGLLVKLERDGYLVMKKNGRCVFRSPLLRDFWRKAKRIG
ncbi:MAG: hypothetical protein FWH21_00345 [Kiritimatiellaeota bacterium]|nr:hypothetical protein [Kiritimatiellota bacterium]